jgi:hypothetical protein
MNELDPTTKTVVEKCINDVITEYTEKNKYFTADSLHFIRNKITDMIHQQIGDKQVLRVNVGIDLSKLTDIPFFFKIDVPQPPLKDNLDKK